MKWKCKSPNTAPDAKEASKNYKLPPFRFSQTQSEVSCMNTPEARVRAGTRLGSFHVFNCLQFSFHAKLLVLEPVAQVSHTKTNSTMIYSSSWLHTEKGRGQRGNICYIDSPVILTHPHLFLVSAKKIFFKSFSRTNIVSPLKPHLLEGSNQTPLLKAWGSADGGLLPSWQKGLTLNICITTQFGKWRAFSPWELGILDDQPSPRNLWSQIFSITQTRGGPTIFLFSDKGQTDHSRNSGLTLGRAVWDLQCLKIR